MDARRGLPDTVKFIGAVQDEWQLYSNNPTDYTLGQPIGFGASSIVYQAEYHSSSGESSPCALKVVDLDSLPTSSLPLLRRETQLMSLSKHPNVLRVRGTWMDGHKLYIALRLMRSGSVADVMQYGWPEGVEEEVAKCILKHALEGLNYLHINGFIHRDVKAANLLIDDDGTVLLGDLGVAVALHDDEFASTRTTILSASGSDAGAVRGKRGKRLSFVGTPCWMAPEVVAQRHYDSKADMWSLGITALELAQGRAPQSREPPHKVLIKTVQDEPPILDREGGQFKYSKAFKEVIQSCLRKDPDESRPTAADLLQMPFFKNTKKKDFLVRALLCGLPPLVERQQRRMLTLIYPPESS
ncbi:kinase-like domain-containing protein [Hysterangium stoloniferum]|nr:kinase-like domain-containing protein [Hysterangium stoloniferum]